VRVRGRDRGRER
jgi:hypothetical protein